MESALSQNWFFIRGLVREASHWDDFPERLTRAIPGSRAHCLDLPGNGAHSRLESPSTIDEMAEFVRAEALRLLVAQKKAGLAQVPTYVFSISLGSMVAIEWARRYPRDLSGIVLVNTSFRSLSPLVRRLSFSSWPLIFKILIERDTPKREALILRMTSSTFATDETLVRKRALTFSERPVTRSNVFRQLAAALRYRPPKSKPTIPILLLNSLGDKMVHPSCSEQIRRHWQTKSFTHATAGHDLPLDDPEWCMARVAEWLGQGGNSGAGLELL